MGQCVTVPWTHGSRVSPASHHPPSLSVRGTEWAVSEQIDGQHTRPKLWALPLSEITHWYMTHTNTFAPLRQNVKHRWTQLDEKWCFRGRFVFLSGKGDWPVAFTKRWFAQWVVCMIVWLCWYLEFNRFLFLLFWYRNLVNYCITSGVILCYREDANNTNKKTPKLILESEVCTLQVSFVLYHSELVLC